MPSQLGMHMNHWRVTKYNPQYRNQKGVYTKEEWTDVADIGKTFQGEVFTLENYLKTEKTYITAIKNFWQASNLNSLEITNLELYPVKNLIYEGIDLAIPDTYRKYFQQLQSQFIFFSDIADMSRLIMRGLLWAKLEAQEAFYLHFGYDFYMYIGSTNDCYQAIQETTELGLFVEKFRSPYLK